MSDLVRIWWRSETTKWGPYPFDPQWQPLEVDPERLDDVLQDLANERRLVYSDEEFQQNLAFAFWADQNELRRLSRFELETELEFIDRQMLEIAHDESIEASAFKPLLLESYERRQETFGSELARRVASETLEVGGFAGPFPRDFPTRLKDDIDLAAFLARHYGLALKRVGSVEQCLCPFHTEKTPSFVVWKSHYRCFGCGDSGDVFAYVQSTENIGFVEAVLRVARMEGKPIPQTRENTPRFD